jgi:hypothetical protein
VAPVASAAGRGLAGVARVVLLAIMAAAVLQAFAILATFAVHRSAFSSFPTGQAIVAFVLSTVAILVMLALALNSSYLPDRIVPRRYLGATFGAVWGIGAAAIIVGLVGSFRLGVYVAVEILPAAVGFVLLGLVTPGLYRRPGEGGDAAGDRGGPPGRGRQRRGGKARR